MRLQHLSTAAILAVLALSACAPAPYEVGGDAPLIPAGPGPVNSYTQATGAAPGTLPGTLPGTAITSGPITSGPIASAAVPPAPAGSPPIGALPAPGPAYGQAPQGAVGAPLSGVAPAAPPTYAGQTLAASSAAVDPGQPEAHSGISDEQDFKAVASRETIESDKQRMERNRAQYQQVAPGALPQRNGAVTVSPAIEYAIGATNRVGQAVFPRGGLKLAAHDRACARYANATEAQEAFLRSGGPQRDGKNLDPDGDGFACTFDPTPFQAAKGAAGGTQAGQGG
jgi:hypothetical protein